MCPIRGRRNQQLSSSRALGAKSIGRARKGLPYALYSLPSRSPVISEES
jgi:hypothetical protein